MSKILEVDFSKNEGKELGGLVSFVNFKVLSTKSTF